MDARYYNGEPDDEPETFVADGGCMVCGVSGSEPCLDDCSCEECDDSEPSAGP